jgi:hypothetical protein
MNERIENVCTEVQLFYTLMHNREGEDTEEGGRKEKMKRKSRRIR